jgi:RNA polymerase sigma-70 factor (ECF subfamily)
MLRSRKSRREELIRAQLPETLASYEDNSDPEQEALLAESVGLALLVLLDNLNPSERVTFVLHEVFDIPFTEIAPIIGKSEAATRQIASRARRRVRGTEGTLEADLVRQREIVDCFITAARIEDFHSLVAALDAYVVLRDDRQIGSLRVTRGATALAKQISGRAKASQSALVNGSVGVIVAPRRRLLYVLKFTIRHGKIAEVDLISNPTRIRQLDLAVLGS